MGALETSRSVSRPVGAASLSALGMVFVIAHARHIVIHEETTFGVVIGAVLPLILALSLVVAGPLLYRSRLDALAITTTAAWGYIGALALACVSLLIVGHQASKGAPLHGPGYLTATATTGGALVGTVAGRYDALNRQKAELIHALQEATASLSTAMTTEEVCQTSVRIANKVLEIPLTGIWLYDEDETALVPAVIAEPATDAFESPPIYRPGNSLSWKVFESGEVVRYDDLSVESNRHNPETIIRSELIVPLGDLGVMNFGSTEPDRFNSLDETVAELLAATTEAALVRADREEALRDQQRLLEKQNRRLEEFTSVVSHDLRNPLSVARGRIELAIETDEDTHLQPAATALHDMESLIEDLLELAKQGHTVGSTEPVSLAEAAENAWRNISSGSATLAVEDLEVNADPDRLRQLLENLFKNAIMHAGSDSNIRVEPLTDSTGFFVADDGPGIPPDERERVFDLGYTDHGDGTGFGLSIVSRIAEAHGWSVRATESEEGGAQFEFRFDEATSSRS